MSDICPGNGESVGYGVDTDICTDIYGFPYIPGKRIMGCLRETAYQLKEYGLNEADEETIIGIFGDANGIEGKLRLSSAILPGIDSMHEYINSLGSDGKKEYLIRQSSEDKIIRTYSSVRGQTSIEESGRAKKGTLRFIRVLNQYDPMTGAPIEFVCDIDISMLNDKEIKLLEKCCKSLRHLGMHRNRGLGNVIITSDFDKNKTAEVVKINDSASGGSAQIMMRYTVEFDSPITLQEYLENGSQIKARTIIGVFAGKYLKNNSQADETFKKIFLDGTVRWSALTPVINDMISNPIPAVIMKLKNDNNKLINSFTCEDNDWKKKKPKSLDGYYMSHDKVKGMCYIAQPEIQTTYHNRINTPDSNRDDKGLYIQDSIKQGVVYGGYVILPANLKESVKELLSENDIRIGRGKKVQYGAATIRNVEIIDHAPDIINASEGEPVFAVLRSDLVLRDGTGVRTDENYIREVISEALNINNIIPEGYHDICRYHVITGYNNMWQMQKPKIQAVMAGSVYCFTCKAGNYPSEIVLGEYQQEGLGLIELMSLNNMKEIHNIRQGNITKKKYAEDKEAVQRLYNALLYEACLDKMNEYAFTFKETVEKRSKNTDKFKFEKVPVGRLRLMLQESADICDLWAKIEEMKTSDVSSEDVGKKKNTSELIKRFYGNKTIDYKQIIKDEQLWEEVNSNSVVYEMVKKHWKEPLFTLLHMIHYQKDRRAMR